MKRITCHSLDDQKQAMDEVAYHKQLDHPNVIKCLDSRCEGTPDLVINSTSEVSLLLPYYAVSTGTLTHFKHIEENIKLN